MYREEKAYDLVSKNRVLSEAINNVQHLNNDAFELDIALLGANNEEMQVGGHIATGYQRAMRLQAVTILGPSFSQFQPRFDSIHSQSQRIADEYLYGINGKPSTRQNIFDVNNSIIHYAEFYLSAIEALRLVPPHLITVDSMRNLILDIARRAESAIEPTDAVTRELNELARRTTQLYSDSEDLRRDMSNHRPTVIEKIEGLLFRLNELKRSVNMPERLLNKELLKENQQYSIVGTVLVIAKVARMVRRTVIILSAAFAGVGVVGGGTAYAIYRNNLAATHREIDRLSNEIDDLEHDLNTASQANAQLSDLQTKLDYASERSSALSLSWRSQYNNMVALSNTVKVPDDILRATALLISTETTVRGVLSQAQAIDQKMRTPILRTHNDLTVADVYSTPLGLSAKSVNSEIQNDKYIREVVSILTGDNKNH